MHCIHQALDTMNQLIKKDMDFLDALFKAAEKHNVCSEELTELYDNQFN